MPRLIVTMLVALLFVGCLFARNEKAAIDERAVDLTDQELVEMRSRAEGIADSLWSLQIANNNDDVAKYTRSMVEDSISFKVYFLPKDSTLLGGGGMIRLSKRDLSVIGGERYQ